jgi:predicted AAA+ superfamily ATPase
MIERYAAGLIARDFEDIDAVFINGGRQTGKSTLAEMFGKGRIKVSYVTFDDISLRSAEFASPGQAFADIEEGLVILDEIQLVPQTFLALKQRIDELRRRKKKVQFLLTGSADIMLLPRLAEALVGRMYVRTLYPFSAAEIFRTPGTFVKTLFQAAPKIDREYAKTDVNSVMAKATFPRVSRGLKNIDGWFRNYISNLLERDVKRIADIDRLDVFPRLLSTLAARTGGLLNDADLSVALKISQPTLKRYRVLLNGVFLTFLLPPWYKDIEKRMVKSPKIYFTDTLLLCHVLGLTPREIEKKQSELYGFILENFAASELLKAAGLDGIKLYHFRTSDKKEIDFIIEDKRGKILAVEVKASAVVLAEDFKHIRFLRDKLPGVFVQGVVLYRGNKAVRFDKDLYALPFSALWEL